MFFLFNSIFYYYYFRQGFNSHVLRFRAKMISKIPDNEDRQFIIRVFLMDDTISIFELGKRNSGISTIFAKSLKNFNIYMRKNIYKIRLG